MSDDKCPRCDSTDRRDPRWKDGRKLKVGDVALTDYEGVLKSVKVIARADDAQCESKILFQVRPTLRGNRSDEWFDSGWFAPVTPN